MKNEKTSNYEKLCDGWRERFLQMDTAELRRRLPELREEGEYLTLFHFGKKYGASTRTGEIAALDGGPLSLNIRLNIYTLFGYVKPDARFQNEWVSFENLRGASPFAAAFRRGELEPFARAFSGRTEQLKAAYRTLGGSPLAGPDAGWQACGFDCIPVRFLFWDGDDEFPAQANLLFDTSAVDFIHVESVVTIASVGVGRLLDAAGLAPDQGVF
jgi:hypothetical protein